jgi:hypothetical protein
MNIVKFTGGLGNQMFQFAFLSKLKKSNKFVRSDFSYYKIYHCHQGYELKNVFNIELIEISESDLQDFFNIKTTSLTTDNELQRLLYLNESESRLSFHYHPDVLNLDNVFYSGFWQSYKYFEDIRSDLLHQFKFIPIFDSETKNVFISQLIMRVNSVSLHVRRGDYLHLNFYIELSAKYYQQAVAFIHNKVTNPVFFIFSDDIEWAKKTLNIDGAYYIDWNKQSYSYRDMQLMSMCKHNIIANSTFSWWAAWLNKNPNKIVICPEVWFTANIDLTDFLLRDWISLDFI